MGCLLIRDVSFMARSAMARSAQRGVCAEFDRSADPPAASCSQSTVACCARETFCRLPDDDLEATVPDDVNKVNSQINKINIASEFARATLS
jgi:hypothetical protein